MVYRIIHPTHRNAGLFSYVWQVLRGIRNYPNEKYYIWFGEESCYFDYDIYQEQGINNVWEYYFEQPHTHKKPDIGNTSSEIGVLSDDIGEYRDLFLPSYQVFKRRLEEYNSIINQYVKLLPHISKKIDDFYERNFIGKKVLGIHLRGTDHPDKLPMANYYEKIDAYEKNYDLIFASSDEQDRIDSLKQRYGSKVVCYPVTVRGNKDAALHYQNSNVPSKYYIGEDVIVESYLLSKTSWILLGTGSNVNYYIRALQPSLPYEYLIQYPGIQIKSV